MPRLPTVAFLNRCYWPDSEATGQLLADLCIDLSQDFQVHVICGMPNSPTTDEYVHHGTETRDGVIIHRLRHSSFEKKSKFGRLLNLTSFSWAARRYLRSTEHRFDLVVSETDPFLLPLVAAKYAKRTDAKLVCYLQDIYPDVAEAIGKVKTSWLTRRLRRRLKSAYDQADRVVVLGDCMERRLIASPWSIDPAKMRVLPNWSDCQSIQPIDGSKNPFRSRHGLGDKIVVMHSGNMGLTQRLDVLIDATRTAQWPDNAVLLLVGDGAVKEALVDQAGDSDRVRFLPYQPRESLGESLSAADLHVVSMHPNITGCLCPSKLYGILAAGRAVLAIADDRTDLAQTVSGHRLGWTCPPGQAGAMAAAVAKAAGNREELAKAGRRAREIALQRYDRPVVTKQFSAMLKELLPTDGTSAGS
ncbi:glycosyltransferase family 4 protein [Rubripirellula lacrimiformis]|uniref:glycosyltransferase family 4 protein n=1 Tax=Rubripirellula lacrimiformis TaxID=1930273 RepID=UPI001C54E0F8|nr:glycosyltransferase family 4 protein [Rubripirellula lacrimiformis]